MLTDAQLLGLDESHISFSPDGCGLQAACWSEFERLQDAADAEGFDLQIVSGFRSFERQRHIWNAKAKGERQVLDDNGQALSIESLSSQELVYAILRFSALPGASRHHWGTDMDIYDAAAVDGDYQIQLTPEESGSTGVFGPMHDWLDSYLPSSGFFRPYEIDQGGVSPERWHLSFQPLADQYASKFSRDLLEHALVETDLELADTVLEKLDAIYERYVVLP